MSWHSDVVATASPLHGDANQVRLWWSRLHSAGTGDRGGGVVHTEDGAQYIQFSGCS
ncbi:MAG: hypothetical protein ACRDRT_10600 [Pseudonocardiaceae bacterium]